MLVFNVISIV